MVDAYLPCCWFSVSSLLDPSLSAHEQLMVEARRVVIPELNYRMCRLCSKVLMVGCPQRKNATYRDHNLNDFRLTPPLLQSGGSDAFAEDLQLALQTGCEKARLARGCPVSGFDAQQVMCAGIGGDLTRATNTDLLKLLAN
jgi:hypothetical protein